MAGSSFDRLLDRLDELASRRAVLGTALAGLAVFTPEHARAEDATPESGEGPVLLFVQTAASGRGEIAPQAGTPSAAEDAGILLTLEGHTGLTVYFSDRPDRIVGAMPTEQFLAELGFSPENPPNAALVGEFKAGQGVVVLQLTDPTWDPGTGTLTYGVEVLDAYRGGNLEPVTREQVAERLPAAFGPAALFIDSGTLLDGPTGEVFREGGMAMLSGLDGPMGPDDDIG